MKRVLILGAAAVAAAGFATIAAAAADPRAQATPKSWKYEIKDGKRVPKAQRQIKPDGSWREEIRDGKCVTVKEKTGAGEYKETRRCD